MAPRRRHLLPSTRHDPHEACSSNGGARPNAGLIRADLDAVDVTRLALAVVLGWLQFHEYIAASTRVADGDALDEIAGALITVLAPPR